MKNLNYIFYGLGLVNIRLNNKNWPKVWPVLTIKSEVINLRFLIDLHGYGKLLVDR